MHRMKKFRCAFSVINAQYLTQNLENKRRIGQSWIRLIYWQISLHWYARQDECVKFLYRLSIQVLFLLAVKSGLKKDFALYRSCLSFTWNFAVIRENEYNLATPLTSVTIIKIWRICYACALMVSDSSWSSSAWLSSHIISSKISLNYYFRTMITCENICSHFCILLET
jgi:hypothetical protein